MDEKTLSTFAVIKNMVHSYFRLAADLKSLAAAETQLAIRSVAVLVMLGIVGLLLAFSTWITLLALLVALLLLLKINLIIALLIILLINVVAIGGIVIAVIKMRKNLGFQATRRQLKRFAQ